MSHDHNHPGHCHHDHSKGVSENRLGLAALLTGVFMVVEVVGGLMSGSLALLADAGHMVTDFASLALAWYAFRLANRPADGRRSYGYDRFKTLAAFTNGLALFVVAAWIVVEAFHRFNDPKEVIGGLMLWVALAGLVVNIFAFWILMGGDRQNLNLRAATLHVAGDLLGSLAAVAAAVVILLTGWMPIDPLLSVLVALIILKSAWSVVRDSAHILLEGTPHGLDSRAVARELVDAIPDLLDVHHVHIWSITEDRPMVTLHARIARTAQPEPIIAEIKQQLQDQFGMGHSTVELEFDRCADDDASGRADKLSA